mgnify:CR=1 FL=1
MKKNNSRRNFIQNTTGFIGASYVFLLSACKTISSGIKGSESNLSPDEMLEACIIGSGFGGAVQAARLSKQWPGKVMIVERGNRYPKGSFPRTQEQFKNIVRSHPKDKVPSVVSLPEPSNGVFEMRNYEGMDVIVANGYGGGSLLYGGALMEPWHPDADKSWPTEAKIQNIKKYYPIVKDVLQARPIPESSPGREELPKHSFYKALAKNLKRPFGLLDTGFFFGNDKNNPLPPGAKEKNKYGAEQEACNFCSECTLGCNYHAKNSVDLNYLYAAENRHNLKVQDGKIVSRIEPLDEFGQFNPVMTGAHGYRVFFTDALDYSKKYIVETKRLIIAAGTLGSTEILIRNKTQFQTLPFISNTLGKGFSGNGDFAGVVLNPKEESGTHYGPTTSQYIKFYDEDDRKNSFVLQAFSIPPIFEIVDWVVQKINSPGDGPIMNVWNRFRKKIPGITDPNLNLPYLPSSMAAYAYVGLDSSDGKFSYNKETEQVDLKWHTEKNMTLYKKMMNQTTQIKELTGGSLAMGAPNWIQPFRRNFTMHPMGGCSLGDSIDSGVVSAKTSNFGEVFSYTNLYVCDGSIIPSGLGANPSLTIAALSEKIAEGITGQAASSEL